MAKITINGITLDPQAQGPELAAAGAGEDDVSYTDYILVQTGRPLNKEDRKKLYDAGVKILRAEHSNTLVCSYKPKTLATVRELPFVECTCAYLQGFKISPALRPSGAQSGPVNALAVSGLETTLSQTPVEVDVLLHENADSSEMRQQVAAIAGLDPEQVRAGRRKLRLSLTRNRLPRLAAVDAVRHIEEHVPEKLSNGVALGILRAGQVHAEAGLRGEGEVITVCDTGFDKGSAADVHPAFTNRVKALHALGRTRSNDPNGHGTHVAGSALGDGASSGMGETIRGAAPEAQLVVQSVLDSGGRLGGLPADLNDLFEAPYSNDDARVHTNSWGSDVRGAYTASSLEVDEFIWNHRDLVVCFAAGNEGTDRDSDGRVNPASLNSPGTAKNCITIGACESERPGISKQWGGSDAFWADFPAEPIASDKWADNPDGMAAFSSRGPTRDQRIKPDVVAPGTAILSAHSRDANVDDFWGLSSDDLYCFMGGTSMATPLVAGCAAVVRQHLRSAHGIPRPSAALVKAMLINGAVDISGQYTPSETGTIPNDAEGFGRVDLVRSVGPHPAGTRVSLFEEETALDVDERESRTIDVPKGVSLLKVTLVWTDPPGEFLQNDLDLIVRASTGEQRHGNQPPGATAHDRFNNIEQINWAGIPAGSAEVIVLAHRITMEQQNYALVVRVE